MTLASSQVFAQATDAQALATHLETAPLRVLDRQEEIQVEYPPLPFSTALLLEEATASLGWTVAHVTETAQALFEAGLITYPRTDSTHLAPEAIYAGQQVLAELYGPDAIGEAPAGETVPLPSVGKPHWWRRFWHASPAPEVPPTEADTPLEAHEAIRPTSPAKTPETLRATLALEAYALYTLIWTRFLASLMKPARYRVITVDLETP
jgi:DNA topoisomerase-1